MQTHKSLANEPNLYSMILLLKNKYFLKNDHDLQI